jgi:D-glycero-alpha-D-manno-heptose-7-phosphate kinase
MIITRTPYRVSFAGGGTDLPSFFREEAGAVLSAAIDRSIYVTVHRRFEPTIRVSYSRTEEAATLDEVRHELVREAMRLTGVNGPLEVTTIGDVPAGTGMGSSSSLTVGLLAALYEYRGQTVTARRLAEEACRIEIDVLGKPIGRQDQYAAAFGGLNVIRFHPDDSVEVEPVACRAETLAELERWALLFFTGKTRDADAILGPQCRATASRRDTLRAMRDELEGEGRLDRFAGLLHDGWELKRTVCCGITTDLVDAWYAAARRAGAAGGKLLGAGGGGFLLVLAPPDRHEAIRAALGRPRELPFRIAPHGARIIHAQRDEPEPSAADHTELLAATP